MGRTRRAALAAVAWGVCMLAPASAADARDVVVTSFDGTKIYAHFFPATKPGAKAPTVLSGHGWGGTGSTAIDGGKGFGTGGNIDIGDLHRAGYNVVTWDARGFGRSGGEAHVDGPDFEARDVMALIDYVAKQPEARLDGPGDPRLGMSGSSYGGGIQLVTAGIDRRIDTIVPDIAWHSLTTSLFKDRSVKFGWGLLLGGGGLSALGNGIIPGVFSPVGLQLGSYWGRIISALAVGAVTGDIPDSDRDWFRSRGPGALVHGIRVPTLLTQGTVDTLFTLQESMENFKVLRGNGVPVKLMWHCGGHGICDFPTGERGHIERAAIRWFKRYLSEDEAIDTGARFEWVDDKGTWHGSGAFPLSRRQPLDLGGTRSGSLGLSPLELQGSPIEATQSSPSAHFNFGAPRAPAEVVGSPQLRLTYTGTALPAKTFVYAQVIDRANGQVVGNQVTPIPVVLDGKQHTISRPLEAIAAHAGPGSKLSLQIIGGTPLYGPQRALGGVRFDAVSATLPVGVPVTGRGGQAALRFGAIGRPRAAAVRRAGGVKRFRVCARDGQVRSISVVVRDRRGKLVARSKRFSTSGCARPAVRGWKRAARGRYTVVAAGRDVSNNRVRVTKAFRLR